MNLKAIRNQVIVLPDPPVQQIGSIVVPDVVALDNPNFYSETGRVVALGRTSYDHEGMTEQPFAVKVGDRVHFNRYAGKQVTCEDDNVLYLVMTEPEITCIVDGDHHILHGYQEPADSGIVSRTSDPFADLQ